MSGTLESLYNIAERVGFYDVELGSFPTDYVDGGVKSIRVLTNTIRDVKDEVEHRESSLVDQISQLNIAIEQLIPWAKYMINENHPSMQKARVAMANAAGETA